MSVNVIENDKLIKIAEIAKADEIYIGDATLIEAVNELKEMIQKLQESRVTCTQAEYNAMSEKKDDVIYVIVG